MRKYVQNTNLMRDLYPKYREYLQVNNEKTNYPIKMQKDFNTCFTKRRAINCT